MPSGHGEVFALIRAGTARTRGEVAVATGLSRVTVAQRVGALLDAGLIRESGTATSSGGRRAAHLEFDADALVVVTIAAETTHTRVALSNLVGAVIAIEDFAAAVSERPERYLAVIAEHVQALLQANDIQASHVGGIGVALPAPIDPATGRPSQPPIMPGWDAYPVADYLSDALGIAPVIVENDANAMALGEQCSRYPDSPSLAFVKVGTGIGTGIVIGGAIYRGIDGGAGDIGHVRLPDHPEALCQCGAHGCLAAVASGRAVAEALSEIGIPAASGRDVGALLAAGDPDAMRLTQEAGRRLGAVMATVVCLINPGALVIGGALASSPLISGMRESLYPLSLPRATRHLDVRLSATGEDAVIIGMTRTVVDQVFAPAVVDELLSGH